MNALSVPAFAILFLTFSHSALADAPPSEPARRSFAAGIAIGLGHYKSASGIWGELFFGHDFELSRSLELRAEVAPLFLRYSRDETLNNVVGQPSFESAPPSIHRRDELGFDDPSLIVSARFAYLW